MVFEVFKFILKGYPRHYGCNLRHYGTNALTGTIINTVNGAKQEINRCPQ